ncbi:hypothetical protein VB738_07095 [Cyanobium gracile UHCC 0139]|uniref:Uncharacterized protein n=1 Tax=Cyanobium gracile UHCC 0139 TaxID=3110308 RepID=A0ABU5RTF2_9CYAN|nr:hypothetical protein [Cyanobium gracile]MEA5391026.1 hypothetical protein [Cyanobium gracile UHCC 0139]
MKIHVAADQPTLQLLGEGSAQQGPAASRTCQRWRFLAISATILAVPRL